MFRTDFEKLSLDCRRQIKPGQFHTAIHLTIWAVQNGPGMLNRNKTGLSLIFWTGLDQIRWKLMFRTDFEKHSLDYRRQLKTRTVLPRPYCAEWSAHAEWSGHLKSYLNGNGVLVLDCFGPNSTQTLFRTDLKGTMANNHDNPNPTFLHSYTNRANGPGTGLAFIFWTGLDQVRWKLVFRTDMKSSV